MNLQEFFPGMGIEEQLRTQLRVVEQQIEAEHRLLGYARKIQNQKAVTETCEDLIDLHATARHLRQLLGIAPSNARLSGKTQSMPGTEAPDRQSQNEAAGHVIG